MKTVRFAVPLMIVLSSAFGATFLLAQDAKPPSGNVSEPFHQANIPGLLHTWNRYWDKGYLVSWGSLGSWDASPSEPTVVLYDRDGHIAREAVVWFKDAYSVSVSDAAISSSGNLVVSGGTENGAGVIANYIAAVQKDGHLGQVIRTTPFMPIYICAAEDGTVWSFGIDRDNEGRGKEESLRLRQFSFGKGQTRAMLDISTLNSPGWLLDRGRYPGEISLRCNSKKVGLYNGESNEWLEFLFSANKLKVAKVNPLPSAKTMRITGFAMTEAGDVFVSLRDRSRTMPRSGIFRLVFDSAGLGSWIPIANTIGPYLHGGPIERLLGTDGTNLVYTHDHEGEAYWSKLTK